MTKSANFRYEGTTAYAAPSVAGLSEHGWRNGEKGSLRRRNFLERTMSGRRFASPHTAPNN